MVDIKLLSFVSRSEKREIILTALENRSVTPTKLARELKIHRSQVSRTLLLFQEKGLARYITPDEKVGRLYELTEKGKIVAKKLTKR